MEADLTNKPPKPQYLTSWEWDLKIKFLTNWTLEQRKFMIINQTTARRLEASSSVVPCGSPKKQQSFIVRLNSDDVKERFHQYHSELDTFRKMEVAKEWDIFLLSHPCWELHMFNQAAVKDQVLTRRPLRTKRWLPSQYPLLLSLFDNTCHVIVPENRSELRPINTHDNCRMPIALIHIEVKSQMWVCFWFRVKAVKSSVHYISTCFKVDYLFVAIWEIIVFTQSFAFC